MLEDLNLHQDQSHTYSDRTNTVYVYCICIHTKGMSKADYCIGPGFTIVSYTAGISNTYSLYILVDGHLEVHNCSVIDNAPLNVSRYLPVSLC